MSTEANKAPVHGVISIGPKFQAGVGYGRSSII